MKVLYDANGFIWEAVAMETCICGNHAQCDLIHENYEVIEINRPGLFCIVMHEFDKHVQLMDSDYLLPKFKLVSNEAVEITDPYDYHVDTTLWERYLIKLHDEVKALLKSKTVAEMQVIYASSPQYKRQVIYDEIEIKWAGKIYEKDMNLSLETLCRIICEYLYIKEVELRELTEDERLGFDSVLTLIRSHSSLMIADGNTTVLNSTGWYHTFLHRMLDTSDTIRQGCLFERFMITGG